MHRGRDKLSPSRRPARKGQKPAGERLRLKPCIHAESIPGEGVYILSERAEAVLKGNLNCRIAPYLDGSHTADDIAGILGNGSAAPEVYYALALAEKNGVVTTAEPLANSNAEAFWDLLGIEPSLAEQRLRHAAVSIKSVGGASPASFAKAVAGFGIAVAREADLDVVVVKDYLQVALEEFNRSALKRGTPWFPVKPVGTVLWIGPVFRPGKSACWACVAQRIRGNREVQSYLQWKKGIAEPFPLSRAAFPLTLRLGAQLAAWEIAKLLAGVAGAGSDLLTLDLLTMELRRHAVIRRPQCPACGEPDKWNKPRIPVLQARAKHLSGDEAYRAVMPAETIERYSHHVSPITGAVTEIKITTDPKDDLMHVYGAGHNFAVRSRNLRYLHEGLRSKSAGKGATDAQAKAGALCEAIERYSGVFQGNEPRIRSSYRRLGESAIHPNSCMLFSERQFAEREKWLARDSRFSVVPLPFDEEAEIDWTPVWSLTRECWKYLPTGYLYYGYPQLTHEFFFWADSNGNAAGNTLEEALLHGFMEVMERDAVCLWWYSRVRRPGLDLNSFGDRWIDAVQRRYAELDRPLWVIDVTTDLGIPAFVAVSARTDKPVEDILIAAGAHFDARIALRRAIAELNQFLPAVLPIGKDGSGEYAFPDVEAQRWWKTATRGNQPYLVPDARFPARTLGDFGDAVNRNDLRDDILACRGIVESRGHEMLVLDQTRPDIGLPVVKVIVPGLRHFWARLGPGRLYDVPVKLGWVSERLAEEDLNPIPIFI